MAWRKRSVTLKPNMTSNTPFHHVTSGRRFYAGLAGVFGLSGLALLCLVILWQTGLGQSSIFDLFDNHYFRHVVLITVQQALLSVAGATIIGVAGALAFFRRDQFFGRHFFLLCCFSAMIMPTSVAALALLKLWGQSGLIVALFGDNLIPDRLGLWSVILAHVFFNAPLIMRVSLSSLEAISPAQRRQAALLGFSALSYFRILEWPAIAASLASVMGLTFLLCFTSFSLVLLLGGGPSVTTLEVSIYTALRFEFNLPQAASLSVIQLVICAVILLCFRLGRHNNTPPTTTQNRPIMRSDATNKLVLGFDIAVLIVIFMLNILPLILLILSSDFVTGLPILASHRFFSALYHSVTLAFGAAAISLLCAVILAGFSFETTGRGIKYLNYLTEITHSLFLIIPALVLGTSLFILLRAYIDIFSHGYWLILVANALLALPFSYRVIAPALHLHLSQTDRLCAMMHLTGLKRFCFITAPALRHEFSFAFALSAALSFGDLGIITLFGSQEFETLPYMLFQFLNRYGAPEADILALILLASAILIYAVIGRLGALWGRFMSGQSNV